MTPPLQRLLDAFDGHDVDEVRNAIADGADVRRRSLHGGPMTSAEHAEWAEECDRL